MNRKEFPMMWAGCLALALLFAWPAAGQETTEAVDVPALAAETPSSPAELPDAFAEMSPVVEGV
ncbi:MAG TPA: hypothetical protein PKI11_00005, partial [Candidatus Hydrogenedentes bacterium]|nr:hypothetical protein [Candidatus Hydrogenedentota bacterium]